MTRTRLLAVAAFAALAVACAVTFGLTVEALVDVAACGVLVAVTVTDLERRIVPNRIIVPALVVALVVQTARDPSLEWILASLAAGGFFLLAALVYPAGLGMGDVKMAAFLGAWLGTPVIVALFAGSLIAMIPRDRDPGHAGQGRPQGGDPVRSVSRGRRRRGALLRRRADGRLAWVERSLALFAACRAARGVWRGERRREVGLDGRLRRRGLPRPGRGAVRDEDGRLERDRRRGRPGGAAARPAACAEGARGLPRRASSVRAGARGDRRGRDRAAIGSIDDAIAALADGRTPERRSARRCRA